LLYVELIGDGSVAQPFAPARFAVQLPDALQDCLLAWVDAECQYGCFLEAAWAAVWRFAAAPIRGAGAFRWRMPQLVLADRVGVF
jgi:hypothetical protein